MVHLSTACTSVAILGLDTLLSTLDFGRKVRLSYCADVRNAESRQWPYYTPRAFTMLVWILSVAMAFALGIMAVWQLWLIAKGETTVEAHDNGTPFESAWTAIDRHQRILQELSPSTKQGTRCVMYTRITLIPD